MSKSIFAYDSSDDECDISKPNVDSTLDKEQLYLYRLGNTILYHKSVVDKYKQDKKIFGYRKSKNSKIITKYLTHKEYSEEDFNINGLSDLLKKQVVYEDHSDCRHSINSAKLLYNQVKDIIKKGDYKQEKGLIDIEKLYCFEVLNKYIKGQANNKDLSEAFGIKKEIVNDFYGKLSKIQNVNKIVSELACYTFNNPIIKDVAQKCIIGELNIEALPLALKLSIQFDDKIRLINSAKLLYNQVKDIIKKGDYKQEKKLIDIEKLYCFEVLNEYIKGQANNKDLSEAFGIKKEIVNDFYGKLSKIQNIEDTVRQLCLLKKEGGSILTQKIYQHITVSREQNLNNFNFVITLACSKKLYDELDHDFVQHNTVIHQGVEKLKFFDEKTLPFSNFLSNSILYQKHLRTAIKFREVQKFPALLNGGYLIDKNEAQIKLENNFTSGLKRTEKVSSLGTYNKIAEILTYVKESLGYTSDIQLVDAVKDLFLGKKIQYDYHEKYQQSAAVKILKDTVYLLFSCEPNRNPSALITNIIFLELVKKGKYKITDMAEKMPMAMSGAIDIGRYLHSKYEDISKCKTRKNDYGKSLIELPGNTKAKKEMQQNIEKFYQKEISLLKDWVVENTNDNNLTFGYILDNHPDYLESLKTLLVDKYEMFFYKNKSKNLLDNDIYQALCIEIAVNTNTDQEKVGLILNQIIVSEEIKSYMLDYPIKTWYNLTLREKAQLTKLEDHLLASSYDQVEDPISLFLKIDQYSLSSFANTENKKDQYQFLECLNYFYIKPIIKIFINEDSSTRLIAHNVLSGVYEDLLHERYYPFNTIYYTNTSNEFQKIKSVLYETTLSLQEIKRIFFTIEDIIEYMEHPNHQFHNFDYDYQLDLLGSHDTV